MVGRESDLDQLQLVARRTFEERRPFLVSIVAPAGVGKSRLLEEFLERLDPTINVAMAQCLPYGQRLTYWPMRAILLSIVGLPESSNPEEVRVGAARWLGEAGEPDPERTAELLAATIGAAEVEGGDRIALFAAWRRLVELAAERSALVLVIEDLHWSSDSLLDLVEAMLQPRADVPLVMIALARPDLLDRRPSWGGGRRNAISISLEPLPSREVATLVADLLDAPAPEIVEAVVERAEGNPFYAGEIVRSLVDRLGAVPDPAAVSAAIAALPDTVHATVLSRLDALEPSARRAVQLGSVIGRTFEPRALPALDSDLLAPVVEAAIEALIERDLVRPSGRSGVTFRHILIREVAFGTLPRAERARLHGAAGTWLEAEAVATGREDELAELVAFHLREAVTIGNLLGDGQVGELAPRAVTWLRRAAEAAAAGAAAVEAARHLNGAIELAPRGAQPELYERLGQIWGWGEQGVEAFERAYQLGRELDLGPDQALRTLAQQTVVVSRWAGSVGLRPEQEELDRRYAQIEHLLEDAVSDTARLHGQLALAFKPMTNNVITPEESTTAQRWADRALEIARRLGDADLISTALDAASIDAFGDDRVGDVMPYVDQRHELGDRLSTSERTDAWIMTAWVETLRGNLDVAERAGARARAGLVSGQASGLVLGASAWRAVALHALGQWDEALREAGRAERSWQESEIRTPGFALNGFLAAFTIARARGDTVAADHWREVAASILQRSDPGIRLHRMATYVDDDLPGVVEQVLTDFRVFTGRLDYVYLALALLADRRHPLSREALDSIVTFSEERGLLLVSSQARRLRGIALGSDSDLEIALAAFESMGARAYIPRAQSELGLISGDLALVEAGLEGLEALGDVEQAARVATQQRAIAAGGPDRSPAAT